MKVQLPFVLPIVSDEFVVLLSCSSIVVEGGASCTSPPCTRRNSGWFATSGSGGDFIEIVVPTIS